MINVANLSPSVNWLNHLPDDWGVTRLANVADIFFSNVDKHTIEGEIPVRLCNYVDVYKNDRITSDIEFMDASAEAREIERFQILIGDVLVTKDSEMPDDIAIPALVVESLPGVLCGYHLAMIRPRKHLVYGSYLAWLHSCKLFRSHYEANAVGVTRFGLSQADFKEARIPLPTLTEQHRIAAYLDKTCAAIDVAIEAKGRQLELLDALRKSIIHKAVTRGLDDSVELKESGIEWIGQIPKEWQHFRIKDVAQLSPGFSNGTPKTNELCTVVPMEAVSEKGEIETRTVEEYDLITSGLTNFEVGDVIFAKITPCMENGKGAYVEKLPTKYASGSTEFHVLRPGYKIEGKFLYYFTYNSVFQRLCGVKYDGSCWSETCFIKVSQLYENLFTFT